jgi:hypothetical protein
MSLKDNGPGESAGPVGRDVGEVHSSEEAGLCPNSEGTLR